MGIYNPCAQLENKATLTTHFLLTLEFALRHRTWEFPKFFLW